MKFKLLATTLLISSIAFTGCSSTDSSSNADDTSSVSDDSSTSSSDNTSDDITTLTILTGGEPTKSALEAVSNLSKSEIGIELEFEFTPGGGDGDNLVKTRLASGDMSDLLVYNAGSKLRELNPIENFIDLTSEEWIGKLDDTFISSVEVEKKVLGIPLNATAAGAILYYKPMYEKYGLEIPKTWDDFIKNCQILKNNGETAIVGSFAESSTTQIPFLGDNANVIAGDPNFVKEYESGTTKYATNEYGLRSFEKSEETVPFYNTDATAVNATSAAEILASGDAGHFIILTDILSYIYDLYGDDVNNIGAFAIPGDDSNSNLLTTWMPPAIYGNKNSENIEAIKEFMKFFITDDALDTFFDIAPAGGPAAIKDYTLPNNTPTAVTKDLQAYFDKNDTVLALEYLCPIKGTSLEQITQELLTGQIDALEAATKYDNDALKQAIQLGYDWE